MAPSSMASREAASQSALLRPASSVKPLAIYWLAGALVGLWALQPEMTQSEMTQVANSFSTGHLLSLGAALLATLITMVAYDRVSLRGERSLHWPTLILFPLLNGLCETILFIASFELGTVIAARFTTQPLWLFLAGTLTFFTYSGVIHALFWLKILPPHLDKSPDGKNIRRVWIIGLVSLSLMWGWLYFAYQDVWSVVCLHILFDVGMVYSIRYRLGQ